MVAKYTDTIQRPRHTDHHEDPGMYGLLGERVPYAEKGTSNPIDITERQTI